MSETPASLYCANHPSIETGLRCNNCEKPICPKCAVLTPTGYRCQECVKGHQKVFDTAEWFDYPISFVLVAVLSFLGSLLASVLGFFTIFVAPIAGLVIAEAARFAVRGRRSPRLFTTAAIAAVLGSLPLLLTAFIGLLSYGALGGLWDLLWQGLYTFTVTSTAYYRLRGINIR